MFPKLAVAVRMQGPREYNPWRAARMVVKTKDNSGDPLGHNLGILGEHMPGVRMPPGQPEVEAEAEGRRPVGRRPVYPFGHKQGPEVVAGDRMVLPVEPPGRLHQFRQEHTVAVHPLGRIPRQGRRGAHLGEHQHRYTVDFPEQPGVTAAVLPQLDGYQVAAFAAMFRLVQGYPNSFSKLV